MNGEFKGSDSNETEPDAQIRADIERFFATNPTATVVGALGTLTLSPNYRELVEDLQPGSDVDTNIDADADTNAESGGESADSKATTDSGSGTCVVHRSEPHDVYIGRGRSGDGHLNNTDIGETGWLGNPYKLDGPGGGYSRKQSIALYWDDLHYRIEHEPEFARALAQLERSAPRVLLPALTRERTKLSRRRAHASDRGAAAGRRVGCSRRFDLR